LSSRLRNAPMLAVNAYLLVGLSIASFGPLEYERFEIGTVFIFVLSVIAIFSTGYFLGSHTRPPMRSKRIPHQGILLKLFRISLVISTLLMSYLLLEMVLSGKLNFNFANSATAYFDSYSDYTRNSGNYSVRFIVTSLGALPVYIAEVLGIFYFRNLTKTHRVFVVYILIATLLVYTLGGGKQKEFGDIVIYIVTVMIVNQALMGRLVGATLLKAGLLALAGVYVLLVLLSYRYRSIGVDLLSLSGNLHPLIHYRDGSLLEGIIGTDFAFPLVMFSGYLGQGYYGLSLALAQPFTWTAFGGSSYAVSVILNQFFGAPFLVESSYPYAVGYATGWAQSKWHTVFAWLASDLTFPGVIIFMGFVGFLYGRVWIEILRFRNPFSLMVFTILNIGFAYAPANNQLMHSPGSLATTCGVLILYFMFHSNFNDAPIQTSSRWVWARR